MPWIATQIGWDQQVLLLWILLPPVFLAAAFLVWLGPQLEKSSERKEDRAIPSGAAVNSSKAR